MPARCHLGVEQYAWYAKAVEKERERETDRSAANNAYSRYLLRGGYISHEGTSAVTQA